MAEAFQVKKPRKPRASETAMVVKPCLEILALRGIFAWRNNTGMIMQEYKGKSRPIRFGAPGSPDIMAILPGGKFLGIECKRPLGPRGGGPQLSPDQIAFGASVVNAGGEYVLVRSAAMLDEWLKSKGLVAA